MPGVLLILIIVGQWPTVFAVDAGEVILIIFYLPKIYLPFSPSLPEKVRYKIK